MIHAFITSRVDHCNTVLHRVSEASVQSLQNVLNAAARMICASGSSTISPLIFEIDYIGCLFGSVSNTKGVSWCTTSVYIRLRQHTLLNCAHRCLNQQAVVTFVLLRGVTWQYHAPEQLDTAKDDSMFPD